MDSLRKDEVSEIGVIMEAAGEEVLLVILRRDGSIVRKGSGAINSRENELFLGKTDLTLFEQYMTLTDDDLLRQAGVYELAEQRGIPARLILVFQSPNKAAKLEFHFGSESAGLPEEIYTLAATAVELSEPWYAAQKAALAQRGNNS